MKNLLLILVIVSSSAFASSQNPTVDDVNKKTKNYCNSASSFFMNSELNSGLFDLSESEDSTVQELARKNYQALDSAAMNFLQECSKLGAL
jgi:hypothetical protein